MKNQKNNKKKITIIITLIQCVFIQMQISKKLRILLENKDKSGIYR
jgi:hypothetical protein